MGTFAEIEKDGVCYSPTRQGLIDYMLAQGMEAYEQLRYLVKAQEVLSRYYLVNPQLREDVNQLIASVKDTLREIADNEDELRQSKLRRRQIHGDDSVADFQGRRSAGKRSKNAISVRNAPETFMGSHTFHLIDPRYKEGGVVASIQDKLVEHQLILPPTKESGCDKPLLVAFGLRRADSVKPIVWTGKLNQLHYFIDYLYQHKVIGCADDHVWKVASELFVDRGRKPITNKQIFDAQAIKRKDEEAVLACLPNLPLKS